MRWFCREGQEGQVAALKSHKYLEEVALILLGPARFPPGVQSVLKSGVTGVEEAWFKTKITSRNRQGSGTAGVGPPEWQRV